jgi:hypothetical protein
MRTKFPLILAFLCVAGGRASAQVNLLPQGSFESPRLQQTHRGKRCSFLAVASGPQWDLYDGALVTRAWYQRQVPIPANWQGRALSLRFDRVCTEAIVYVNGTRCGKSPGPGARSAVSSTGSLLLCNGLRSRPSPPFVPCPD